jgi:two-component system, response regulator
MSGNSSLDWVLVVEDNPDDERLVTRVFHQTGRNDKLFVARDGEEAIKLLQNPMAPQLVLLDLKLPRLSGMDVLTWVRANDRLSTLPVVVLTSSNETSDVAACYGLGCNGFVRKEIDFDSYVKEISTTLKFWLDINCPPPLP